MKKIEVGDLMTRPRGDRPSRGELHWIAARLMERAISAVPVIDHGGSAIGVVSEADLLFQRGARDLE